MYDKVLVKFKEENLGYGEKLEVLLQGRCEGIFPISIVKNKESITGFYSTSRYKRLSEFNKLTAGDVLTVVDKIASAIEECNQYLIFPEEYLLTLDTVYAKENFEKVKFTYIPDKNKTGVGKKMKLFLKDLKGVATENGSMYLDMLKEFFDKENLSPSKIKNIVMQLKREVNLCDIY